MSIDMRQVDRSIRESHSRLGRTATERGSVLAQLCPRTMAAAVWGGQWVWASASADAMAILDRGIDRCGFGVARQWGALDEIAEHYGEPRETLAMLEDQRGGRYSNQPAWVLRAMLAGAERAMLR